MPYDHPSPGWRRAQRSGFSGIAGAKDAEPLGTRAILAQVKQDLFLTKDVQDNPTGTYIWLADQLGHFVLGLLPAQLICWLWPGLARIVHFPAWSRNEGWLVSLIIVGGAFTFIEFNGVAADKKRAAGGQFPLDTADLEWNAKTTIVYVVIGAALAAAAFSGWTALLWVLLLAIWPALAVATWWLRCHLSFQQTGAPYLYRLANFKARFVGPGSQQAVDIVAGIASLANRKIHLLGVLLGRPATGCPKPLQTSHLLITGPLLSGKTSLAVGITTEFAFALGTARFLSPIDLLESLVIPDDPKQKLDFDDGILLWKVPECTLIVVDDVDSAVTGPGPGPNAIAGLVRPDDFAQALRRAAQNQTPLAWLKDKRSVWVIGDTQGAPLWKDILAELMGAEAQEFAIVALG